MPNQPRLKVIKVPLDYEPAFQPINFAPMPRLYLEFLENKNKVKPELRNKEYIPKLNYSHNLPSLQAAIDYAQTQSDNIVEATNDVSINNTGSINKTPVSSREGSRDKREPKSFEKDNSSNKKLQILDISKMSEEDIADFTSKKRRENKDNIYKHKKPLIQDYENAEADESDIGYKPASKDESFDRRNERPVERKSIDKKDPTEQNLFSLLKGETVKEADTNTSSSISAAASATIGIVNTANNLSTNNIQSSNSISNIPNLPPSISEINSGKVPTSQFKDLSNSLINEDELSRKRKILSDLERIRKHDKDANIPKFSEITDIATLEREYANIVRNLHVDSNVENYKKWLTMGFVGLEYFLVNWIKFEDIKGFSSDQILNMNKYEKILVEIGEKSYVPEEKRLAPEIRLLGIVAMNAAIFVGMRMLGKSMGGGMGGMGGMFGNFMNMNTPQTNNFQQSAPNSFDATTNKPKKKMPPPDIDLDDLNFKKND